METVFGTYNLNITGISQSNDQNTAITKVDVSNGYVFGGSFNSNFASGGNSKPLHSGFAGSSGNASITYIGYNNGLSELFLPYGFYQDLSNNNSNVVNQITYGDVSRGYLATIGSNSFNPANNTFSVAAQSPGTNSDFGNGNFIVTDGQNFSTTATFVSQEFVNGLDVLDYHLAQAPTISVIYRVYAGGYLVGTNGLESTPTLNVALAAPTYTIAESPASGLEGTPPGAGTPFTYTVTRTGNVSQAGTVDLTLSGTTTPLGTAGADYSAASGTGIYTSTGTGSTGTLGSPRARPPRPSRSRARLMPSTSQTKALSRR